MSRLFNQTLLMSTVDYFDDSAPINAFMDASVPVDRDTARQEHEQIRQAFVAAGINVIQLPAPTACQDGVYTANWALVRGDLAVLANLPNVRQPEQLYAEQLLKEQGKTVLRLPETVRFSGQGDALPCGNYLFMGTGYRTDPAAHQFVSEALGYEAIPLQTVPVLDIQGQPVINAYSGWPDSFFYDIDLALAVLRNPDDNHKGLIAWCPEAFTPESQTKLRSFDAVDKIEVSLKEAKEDYACNLVSTGETVIMSAFAPDFKAAVEKHGFKTITPQVAELAKGGGYIRCTSLTLDNPV